MSNSIADRFIEALSLLESDRDPEPITKLFSADSECGNLIAPEKFHGSEGARDFWTKYRDTFQGLRSTFRNKIVQDGRIALEWSTEATLADGARVEYSGVSVIEVSGQEITRFRAYFDPAALAKQIETADSGGAHRL